MTEHTVAIQQEPAAESLEALALAINDVHRIVVRTNREAVMHALRCGALLAEAKARVTHGEWLPWLRANFEGAIRTAQLYMRLARDPANAQRLAHLGVFGVDVELAFSGGEISRQFALFRAVEYFDADAAERLQRERRERVAGIGGRGNTTGPPEWACVTPADASDAPARRCSELVRAALVDSAGAVVRRAVELAEPGERERVARQVGPMLHELAVYLERLADPAWRWTNSPIEGKPS